VVWVVVGLAALLLAVAIVRRLVLRARHGSAGPPASGPPAMGGT